MRLKPSKKRMLSWAVQATNGFESAWLSLGKGLGFRAEGRILARTPEFYWAVYSLEVDSHGVTRKLSVTTETGHRRRRLEVRNGKKGWSVMGRPAPEFLGALDCDIAYSPLTNTMPILRHQLHRKPGSMTFLMVFIEMPGLRVVPSRQTYTRLPKPPQKGLVHFSSGGFKADLRVDSNGFVVEYPGIGERLGKIPGGD